MFSHKYSAAQKIRACEDYLSGKYNSYDACERNGIHYKKETRSDSTLRQWVAKYKLRGASAFSDDHLTTKSYSSITKINAVEDYLSGKGSITEYDYNSNLLKFKGNYLNGERNGTGIEYDTFGNLKFKGEYLNGLKWNGKVKEYYNKGQLRFEGEYLNGKRKGKEYDYNGNLNYEEE